MSGELFPTMAKSTPWTCSARWVCLNPSASAAAWCVGRRRERVSSLSVEVGTSEALPIKAARRVRSVRRGERKEKDAFVMAEAYESVSY
tara:strand:+ start:2689 stop:2955 length:267 start_codon:yes stop_codon:yes gene_type:complete